MILLCQKWSEKFAMVNPRIQVQATGGGSGTGISALINGTTDIATASRPMKPAEREQIKQKFGSEVVEIPVARDAIAIYVHRDNPLESLTIDQLRGIYSGTIKNWKQIGGEDAAIILYGRENSSGTYEFFKEHVLDKSDFPSNTQTLQGTAAIVSAIGKDSKGIGYGGAAYSAAGVKQIKLAGADGEAMIPTAENVTMYIFPFSVVRWHGYTVDKANINQPIENESRNTDGRGRLSRNECVCQIGDPIDSEPAARDRGLGSA